MQKKKAERRAVLRDTCEGGLAPSLSQLFASITISMSSPINTAGDVKFRQSSARSGRNEAAGLLTYRNTAGACSLDDQ